MRYKTKPVEVEAMQWDGSDEGIPPIVSWMLRLTFSVSANTSGNLLLLGTDRQALALEPSHWLLWLGDDEPIDPRFKILNDQCFKRKHEEIK